MKMAILLLGLVLISSTAYSADYLRFSGQSDDITVELTAREFCSSFEITGRDTMRECRYADWKDNEGDKRKNSIRDCGIVVSFDLEKYYSCLDEGENWFRCLMYGRYYQCIARGAD